MEIIITDAYARSHIFEPPGWFIKAARLTKELGSIEEAVNTLEGVDHSWARIIEGINNSVRNYGDPAAEEKFSEQLAEIRAIRSSHEHRIMWVDSEITKANNRQLVNPKEKPD